MAYVGSILLLIGVLFFGNTIKGATSWYNLGGFSLQPSEFAKIIYIVCLARFLCRPSLDLKKWLSRLQNPVLYK